MVATGYRSRGNRGMAEPSCKQVSKQACIALHAARRAEGEGSIKSEIERDLFDELKQET